MSKTRIEWAEVVWNPVTGCSKVSPGCKHCYAERFSRRLAGRHGYPSDDPFRVTLHPERLEQPWMHGHGRRVFVNSMSDLFHRDVSDEFIGQVFKVMAKYAQHTYLILTKRPERMLDWAEKAVVPCCGCGWHGMPSVCNVCYGSGRHPWREHPYPWVWLGVSAETQEYADERVPLLLKTPAAVRFVSCEPLLGPINLQPWLRPVGWWCDACGCSVPSESVTYEETHDEGTGGCGEPVEHVEARLDWVIVGGETGPGARPMHPQWVRDIRDACQAAGVPFFFKQWGEHVGGQVMERLSSGKPGWCNYENNTATPMWTHDWGDGFVSLRVGKSVAGRLLDGRTWDALPGEGVTSRV